MPWREQNIMNQRTEFALRAMQTDNFRQLCREYGISAKTGYKWKERFIAEGLGGLGDESRRPKSNPQAVSEEVVCRLVKIKVAHPFWGASKVRDVYLRTWGQSPASLSTVKRILERSGLVQKRKRRRAVQATGRLTQGRKASAANDVWTVDFKGWWRDSAGRSNPLTVRDEASRYVLELRHLEAATTEEVRRCFERLFERYGLPQAIRSDNGPPFASSNALLGLSALSAWWLALGIELERGRPGKPQDNAAHERMHRDIKREIQSVAHERSISSARERQARFDAWREEFNQQRPHEALGMKRPAEVYVNSTRRYRHKVSQPVYVGMETRRVQSVGRIKYENIEYSLTSSLRGWEVGIKAIGADRMEVYFCQLLLGWLEPETESFIPNCEPHRQGKSRGEIDLDGEDKPFPSASPPSRSCPPRPNQSRGKHHKQAVESLLPST